MKQHIRALVALTAALALLACTRPITLDRAELDRAGAAVALDACCDAPQKVPQAVVRMAESCALPLTTSLSRLRLRHGYLLGKAGAQAHVLALAQPLDVFATTVKARAAGQLSLGYFSHMSVYVGDAAALRKSGLWDDPAVTPWHARLMQGPMVIEARAPAIKLVGRMRMFDADALAVLRPTGLSAARKKAALRDVFKTIGTPFDPHFDARTSDKVFCSELPARVLPELNLPVRTVYGRPSYIPDEAVAHSLQGKIPLRFSLFVVADQDGWKAQPPSEAAARILEYWPKPATN